MTARAEEEAEEVVLDPVKRMCIVRATQAGRRSSDELSLRGLVVGHWKDLWSRQAVEAAKILCQGMGMSGSNYNHEDWLSWQVGTNRR